VPVSAFEHSGLRVFHTSFHFSTPSRNPEEAARRVYGFRSS
jgi:hypothetical protein